MKQILSLYLMDASPNNQHPPKPKQWLRPCISWKILISLFFVLCLAAEQCYERSFNKSEIQFEMFYMVSFVFSLLWYSHLFFEYIFPWLKKDKIMLVKKIIWNLQHTYVFWLYVTPPFLHILMMCLLYCPWPLLCPQAPHRTSASGELILPTCADLWPGILL